MVSSIPESSNNKQLLRGTANWLLIVRELI
jgi:hypothetical protein